MDSSIDDSGESLKELQSSGDKVNEFAAGAGKVADGTTKLVGSVGEIRTSLNSSLSELQAQRDTLGGQVAQAQGVVEQLEAVDTTKFQKPEEFSAYVKSLIEAERTLGQLQGAYSAVDETIDKLSASTSSMEGSEEELKALKEGAETISKNASSISEYTAGTNALIGSMFSLQKPVRQLAAGATNLSNGISKGDDSLIAGAAQLLSGVETYTDGVNALYDGAEALAEGSGTLADGANALHDGAVKLSDGSYEMAAGVDELTESIDPSEITDSVDRIRNVNKAGKRYHTFTGLAKNEKGKVKFIIKTDGVSKK